MKITFHNITTGLAAVLIAVSTLCQCSHPFDEGMIGSFPTEESETGSSDFRLLSSSVIELPGNGSDYERTGTISIQTDSYLITSVSYQTGGYGWISISSTTRNPSNNTATVKFVAGENGSENIRQATITVYNTAKTQSVTVKVNQLAGSGTTPPV